MCLLNNEVNQATGFRYECANFSVLDIVLFTIIILLATSTQMAVLEYTFKSSSLSEDIDLKVRTELTLDALLRTTPTMAEFEDHSFEIRDLKPIKELIIESLYSRSFTDVSVNTPYEDLVRLVYSILSDFTRPSYGFWFTAGHGEDSLIIASLDNNRSRSNEINMVNVERSHNAVIAESHLYIEFKLGMWRV
jgi:hypothetical protein